MKKILITTGIVSLMMIGNLTGKTDNVNSFGTITAYASEQTLNQSSRWEGQGDTWRVKDNAGGYLINSWFQDDVTGHWYMLGADGAMYSGLITDQSTGKSYLLNTNHDGTYGRMLTINGVYNVNGKEIYLEFNQAHDGSYGGITRGLTEARGAGIKETGLASIPTDSATTSPSQAQTQTQTQNQTQNTSNNSNKINPNNMDTGQDIDWSQYDPADFGGGKGTGQHGNWSSR